MKIKAVGKILGLCLGAALLTGCAETPESSLVKQKGAASLKNYEERETLSDSEERSEEEGSPKASDKSEETNPSGESASLGEKASSGENKLRSFLGAPEHYESQFIDESGKLQILTDASVEIPDADKVSAIAVSQHPFTQEIMDRVTDTFFPDATIYSEISYYKMTKEDYRKQIETLKGYAAEGNLDPYNYGMDENGDYIFDIYRRIENAEAMYENAPESKELQEVHPQFGISYEMEGETYVDEGQFGGVACTADGKAYVYRMSSFGATPMEIYIDRQYELEDRYQSCSWIGYEAIKEGNPEAPDEEELKEEIGISYEEAKALADEKVAKLNIPSMELDTWKYSVLRKEDVKYTRENQVDAGYEFYYTRKINNIPITYTIAWGGCLESMESETETWDYEILNIIVTKEGIARVQFFNQYDLGETKTENLNLLSFDEIMKIYEKMMFIQSADIIDYVDRRTYRIDRITFGYTRIYEPASDAKTGILVPVWDFFGSFENVSSEDGKQYEYTNVEKNQSYLTINAVDGSIIDRDLGY